MSKYNYTIKTRVYDFKSKVNGGQDKSDTNPTIYDNQMTADSNLNKQNCYTCKVTRNTFGPHHNLEKRAIEKQIQKTVRVQSSEYTMNKSSLNVAYKSRNEDDANASPNKRNPWNQSSDRFYKSNSLVSNISYIPTRGNSLRTSITRLRPGSLRPGGKGVDVKHNSYHRYLARLKGKKVLKQEKTNNLANYNNVEQKFNIVTNCSC